MGKPWSSPYMSWLGRLELHQRPVRRNVVEDGDNGHVHPDVFRRALDDVRWDAHALVELDDRVGVRRLALETGVRWLMDDRVGVDPAATAYRRPLQLLREADRALLARVEDPTGAGDTALHDQLMTLRCIPVGRGQRFELGSRQRLRGRLAHAVRGC